MWAELRRLAEDDPLLTLATLAALVAFATTPIAFAVLGRLQWFRARRGRTIQRPEFWSVIASMLLVMMIPAIFVLLALKSRHYDESRYEFDPNLTISVLDQGRQYRTVKEADEAVRAEQKRLVETRQTLVNSIKELDEAMLGLRAAAVQHPATYQAIPEVLDRLASVHKQIGLDAPQQLLSEVAPPAELPQMPAYAMAPFPTNFAPGTGAASTALAAPVAPTGKGLSTSEREIELAGVPEPQRGLASMLPLANVPVGWVLAEMGGKHLETFNAENLYEKIDGRAESFVQYDVVGMAYTYYHLEDDEGTEAQLYIFELSNPLKAFGKYSSEKPGDAESLDLGDEGYVSAGSVFFYSGPYYTQVVTTSDETNVAEFAMEIARKVAARQQGGSPEPTTLAATTEMGEPSSTAEPTPPSAPAEAAVAPPAASNAPATPAQLFKLLPAGPNRSSETYAAQDVFGYDFLSDVFLADYKPSEDEYWQGFLRPYHSPERAAEVFDQYVAAVKEYGGEVEEIESEDAQTLVISSLYGLYDAIFLKGNTVAGANGGNSREPVEAFSKEFARQLPVRVPTIDGDDSAPAGGSSEDAGSE